MQAVAVIDSGHHLLVAFLFVVANIASAARLLLYRRNGARFRLGMSWLAYLLIVGTGGQALDVLVQHEQVTVWQTVVALLLAVLVYRAQGNVACIVSVRQ